MNRFGLLTTRKFLSWFMVYSLWFIAVSPQLSTINSQLSTLNSKETKLATIPEDYEQVDKIVFSANGKQVAYKVRKEGKPTPFVEGRGKEFVVVGNQAGKLYERAAMESLFLSPDGQYLVYRARRGEGERFIVVGHLFGDLPMRQVEGPVCDEVWQPIISRGELRWSLR